MDKGQYGRNDRLLKERRHDVYRQRGKLPEPTVCGKCGALLRAGRWTWGAATPGAQTTICPACRRIADGLPAGYLEIRGAFFGEHREELHNLVRNIEEQEKSEHPLERIMALVAEADYVLVTTTGIHLARRLGEALASAYQGELDLAYGDGEQSIRVIWRRD
jgi:NMD protein affecting ribosome stability and mRNA decay